MERQYGNARRQHRGGGGGGGGDEDEYSNYNHYQQQNFRGNRNKHQQKRRNNHNQNRSAGQGAGATANANSGSTGTGSSSGSTSTSYAAAAAVTPTNLGLDGGDNNFNSASTMQEVQDHSFVGTGVAAETANHQHVGDGDTNGNNSNNFARNSNDDSVLSSRSSLEFVSATEDSFSTSSYEPFGNHEAQNDLNANAANESSFSTLNASGSSTSGTDADDAELNSSGTTDHTNGNASTEEENSRNTSVIEVDQEEDDDQVENPTTPVSNPMEADQSYTHASLIVNLSSESPLSVDFREQRVDVDVSPLSSARSAPPDLDHGYTKVDNHNDDIIFSSTPRSAVKSAEYPQTNAQNLSSGLAQASTGKSVTFDMKSSLVYEDEEGEDEHMSESMKVNSRSTVEFSELDTQELNVSAVPIDQELEESKVNSNLGSLNVSSASSVPNSIASVNGNASAEPETEHAENMSGSTESTVSTLEIEQQSVANSEPSQQEAKEEFEDVDREVSEINSAMDDDALPKTVTKLVGSNGTEVYLIGTAHFSLDSQQDVVKTIQKIRPQLVMLELCHARRHILAYDEETILREAQNLNFEKIRYTLRTSGAIQGALHLLLLSMSCSLTKKLGMAPGGEFRVACREAQKMPNCSILFGDRMFTVTLARALHSLTFGQKIKLAWQFLTSDNDITKEEIERCKEKDILEQMLEEMTGEYPSISNVFVAERDIYLAHSLWLAALSTEGPVVGVVGMGHVPGMKKQWGQTNESMVNHINEMPKSSKTSIVLRKTVKLGFYCLIGFGIYKVGQKVVTRLPISNSSIPETFAQFKIPVTGLFKR